MKHTSNIYKYAKKLNCNPNKIIDFSSSINSYHPEIDIKVTNEILVRYGDASYKDLKLSIAKKYEVKKKQIALFNGATSAIFELLKLLNPSRVYLYAPLFEQYEQSIPKDTKVLKINRLKNLYHKPKKGSTVIFVNPSTPDGKYYEMEKLFTLWKEQDCTIILDESFLEFEVLKSLINQINTYKKLYIVQSFSKFYSCAGVRIGAIFSHKSNIKKFTSVPWKLSSFDVAFLTQRLSDKIFDKRSKNLHQMHKKELFEILIESHLFKEIYESRTNFFMVKSKNAQEIFKSLLKEKILLDNCHHFDFLGKKYLRIAVKDTRAHYRLKEAFSRI